VPNRQKTEDRLTKTEAGTRETETARQVDKNERTRGTRANTKKRVAQSSLLAWSSSSLRPHGPLTRSKRGRACVGESDLGLPQQVPSLPWGLCPAARPPPSPPLPSPSPHTPLALTRARTHTHTHTHTHTQHALTRLPTRNQPASPGPIVKGHPALPPYKFPSLLSHPNLPYNSPIQIALSYKVGLHTALTQLRQR
jgi:hypothetical protein